MSNATRRNHLLPYTATDVRVTVKKKKKTVQGYEALMPTRRCLPHGSPFTYVCQRSHPYEGIGIGLEKQRIIKKDYAVSYKALSITSSVYTNEVILIRMSPDAPVKASTPPAAGTFGGIYTCNVHFGSDASSWP